MLAIAGGLAGAALVAGGVMWGLTKVGPRSVPLIEPDPRPIKIRPDDPGGLRVLNQDELIYDRDRSRARAPNTGARLAPEPEGPRIDALRAQVNPPPARPPAPQAAAPAAPAAAPPGAPPATRTAQGPAASVPAAPAQAPQAAAPNAPAARPAQAPPAPAAAPPPAPPAATPAAAPPATPSFAAVANGRVQVQLGAVSSEDAARGEWDRILRRVPELGDRRPNIVKFEREGQPTMWRIRAGGFADRSTATAFCEHARSKGAPCVVIGG